MNPKWVAFAVSIWVVAILLGAIMEGATPYGTSDTNILNAAALPSDIFDIGAWYTFLGALFDIMTLNFTMFQGNWVLIRLIVLAPIIMTLLYGVVITVAGLLRPTA